MGKKDKEFQIRWKTDLPYRYSIGKLAVKYFEELKNRRIMGSKCPKCGKVNMPPRGVCADCFVEMTVNDMVELSRRGTLEGFTVVNYPFVDPNTGAMRPFPYGYLICKLDGADTYLMHFCDETDYNKFKIGQRVEAVFCDELPEDHENYRHDLKGDIYDIPFFRIIKNEEKKNSEVNMSEELEKKVFRGKIKVPYKHTAGAYVEKFITDIGKDRKIMGVKCPKCGKVFVPPKMICFECFEKMEEWVEVGNQGTLKGFTVVTHKTSVMPLEPPYAYGIIRLDGADTDMVHLINEGDPHKLKIGMRVEASFYAKPRKRILDIEYFKPI